MRRGGKGGIKVGDEEKGEKCWGVWMDVRPPHGADGSISTPYIYTITTTTTATTTALTTTTPTSTDPPSGTAGGASGCQPPIVHTVLRWG